MGTAGNSRSAFIDIDPVFGGRPIEHVLRDQQSRVRQSMRQGLAQRRKVNTLVVDEEPLAAPDVEKTPQGLITRSRHCATHRFRSDINE
jgi:hypothetical protein